MNTNEMAQALASEFPGAALATLREQLREAQRVLCTDGNAWIVDDGPAVVGANTPFAEVEIPDGGEALRIIQLLDERGVTLRPGLDYVQSGANAVRLKSPVAGVTLRGQVACRPVAGRDMPDELLARWEPALKNGARAKLYLLPQPWRDPAMAQFYQVQFNAALSDARQSARLGYQAGGARIRAPRFN